MKAWGVGILCLGIVVLIGSLFMPTSVPASSGPYDQIFNLQRAYDRSLVFESGWFLILGGLVLIAGGAVLERIASIGASEVSGKVTDGNIAERAAAKAVADMGTADSPSDGKQHDDADRFLARFAIGGTIVFVVILVVFAVMNGSSGGSPQSSSAAENIAAAEAALNQANAISANAQ